MGSETAVAAPAGGPVLEIEELSVAYAVRGGYVRAVRGASLRVAPGETVALVGESGSGKSSLAFAVMGALEANGRVVGGAIRFQGRSLLDMDPAELQRLRGARMAMVFQDPQTALNPSLTVGEQVVEVLRVHEGLGRDAARERTQALFAQVNLPEPVAVFGRYPHELSGGQQQRIVIAMAFACNPELLILDEPTTGLDVTTEARILDLLEDLTRRYRSAVLYITHNLGVVARFCQRVVVMYAGEMVEEGAVARVFAEPRHPYTRGLLVSAPRLALRKRDAPLSVIEGGLPSLVTPPAGCVFEPRCPERVPACAERKPPAEPTPDGGLVRCLRWADLVPFSLTAPARHAGAREPAAALPEAVPAEIRLDVERLRRYYSQRLSVVGTLRGEPAKAVRAVDDVTLAVERGRTLSVVGESGCGKTTLARCVVGLLEPTGGAIRLDGASIAALARRRPREVRRRVQIVFQNPDATLNPQKTVEETLRRPLELFGLATGEARERRIAELLAAVRLPESYRRRYPHELSGGEKQRVAIARAFAAEPELIVCDEPLSALDVSVQAAVINLLVDLQRRSGTAYLFISHDLSVVRYLSDRLVVMYLGKVCEVGTADELFQPPYHPYTEALLSAIPIADPAVRQRKVRLEGPVPSPLDPGPGCRFHTRCPRKLGAICEREEPPAREDRPGHVIHCHIPLEELRQVPPVIAAGSAGATGEASPP